MCAFLKEKAHEVQGTHETSQEIGDVGHPAFVAGMESKGSFTSAEVAVAVAAMGPDLVRCR